MRPVAAGSNGRPFAASFARVFQSALGEREHDDGPPGGRQAQVGQVPDELRDDAGLHDATGQDIRATRTVEHKRRLGFVLGVAKAHTLKFVVANLDRVAVTAFGQTQVLGAELEMSDMGFPLRVVPGDRVAGLHGSSIRLAALRPAGLAPAEHLPGDSRFSFDEWAPA